MVISVKIRNFSRSRMTKWTSPLESSREIYLSCRISSNFVEFRDSRNFTFFETRRGVRDTWHFISGSRGATYPGQNGSNNELRLGP